jgi:hypothetical protein
MTLLRFHANMQWRERLVVALRAMNAGDLAEQALRQADKMCRSTDRTTHEPTSVTVHNLTLSCIHFCLSWGSYLVLHAKILAFRI